MTRIIALAGILALGACTAAQTNAVITQGQLYCAIASVQTPLIVAMADAATGKPVSVIGKAANIVAAECAIIGGIPVVPPAVPAAAPIVAVKLPAA